MKQPSVPEAMTASERTAELASILAAGILRIRCREVVEIQDSLDRGEKVLDFIGNKSVHSTNP